MPIVAQDIIEQSSVRDTINGVEFHRVCFVSEVFVGNGINGYDFFPIALASAGVAQLYSAYPSVDFNGAICVERSAVGIAGDSVKIDQVYRATINYPQGQSPFWALTDQGQSNYIQTNKTAGSVLGNASVNATTGEFNFPNSGVLPTFVAYPPIGANPPSPAPPVNYQMVPLSLFKPYRVLRASAAMLATYWNTFSGTVRSYVGSLNSTNWGSYTRGQWMLAYINLRTEDFGYSYFVDLDFIYDPDGLNFYPYGQFVFSYNQTVPTDAVPELLSLPPVVGSVVQATGTSRFSIYNENDFSSLFTFVPPN